MMLLQIYFYIAPDLQQINQLCMIMQVGRQAAYGWRVCCGIAVFAISE
jgi:hypothetical protein